MPHTESAWRTEIASHCPQGCDYAELASPDNELFSWRSDIAVDGLEAELESWKAFVKANRLSVAVEQSCEDGVLVTEEELSLRLNGCPSEFKARVLEFAQKAPEPVRDYLAYFCYWLVKIERKRRTGHCEWRSEAPSGSPEVLRELMFKWGPRFHRHRWTW